MYWSCMTRIDHAATRATLRKLFCLNRYVSSRHCVSTKHPFPVESHFIFHISFVFIVFWMLWLLLYRLLHYNRIRNWCFDRGKIEQTWVFVILFSPCQRYAIFAGDCTQAPATMFWKYIYNKKNGIFAVLAITSVECFFARAHTHTQSISTKHSFVLDSRHIFCWLWACYSHAIYL